MSSNPEFVKYIVEQCSGAGQIEAKKMFGDYGIYCNGKFFGLISDNGFYIKPIEELKPLLHAIDMRPPYEGAKDYFYINDVDDHAYLSDLVANVCKYLPEPKPKKKKN